MYVLLLCSTWMFKAILLLQICMLCYYLHLLLLNIMLYVTHTLLNMYLILFRFIANTNHWLEKFAYSKRHIICRYFASIWLIRSVAERRLQRLGFQLPSPFDIRYRQVELVQVFIQVLLLSHLTTLPPISEFMLCCVL